MFISLVAIALGAALGAILRWGLALGLNPLFPGLPPGTLVANVVGGYLIGVAMAFFLEHPGLPPVWRLFAVTGFLGGLTTFSTFSAEVVTHLTEGRLAAAGALMAAHLAGSVGATLLGVATWKAFSRAS